MDILASVWDEIPLTDVSPETERTVLTAIQSEAILGTAAGLRRPVRRAADGMTRVWGARTRGLAGLHRPRRLVLASGLGLVLAAGLLAGEAIPFGGSKPAASASAMELAQRAVAAASGPRTYPAGKWFFVRELSQSPPGNKKVAATYWRTAGPAPLIRTPGVTSQETPREAADWKFRNVWAQRAWTAHGQRMTGAYAAIGAGRGSITFRDLRMLPSDPKALISYLAARDHGDGGFVMPGDAIISNVGTSQANRVFASILEIFAQYIPAPKQAAVLYRAVSELPGVTLDRNATDVAMRHGAAFTMRVPTPADMHQQWAFQLVVNPRTFAAMGVNIIFGSVDQHGHHVVQHIGYAFLAQVPVSGPWARPWHTPEATLRSTARRNFAMRLSTRPVTPRGTSGATHLASPARASPGVPRTSERRSRGP